MALLQNLLNSSNAEFLAVYGRRRVGKTFLLRKFYADHIVFQMTGAFNASTTDHLNIFNTIIKDLEEDADLYPAAKDWFAAFELLKNYIQKSTTGKKVIFFDELPWIDTTWRAWSGYAYDSICHSHIVQIKKALGISGVYTEASSWIDQNRSTQIDLLIDRRDHIINICEIKFAQQTYSINKGKYRKKSAHFQRRHPNKENDISNPGNDFWLTEQ